MTDPKIPPKLWAMPFLIHEQIVSSSDFRTKLCLNHFNSCYRGLVKREIIQYHCVKIVGHDDRFVLQVCTTVDQISILEYFDHEGGYRFKCENHERIELGRTSTEAIVSDLSLILLNPRVLIKSFKVVECAGDEERMENLIDAIEVLLTSRTEQLHVKKLTLCIEDSPDYAPKILLHVAPGILESFSCGSELEELDLEEFARYEQIKQLRELEGQWYHAPLECWKHLVKFEADLLFVPFEDIPDVIEAAFAHGDSFKEYEFATQEQDYGNPWTRLARFFNFFGPGRADEFSQTKYIKLRNSTNFLKVKWSNYDGLLVITRCQRDEIVTDPVPPNAPSPIVTGAHIIHRPVAVHPHRYPNFIPTYLQPIPAPLPPIPPVQQNLVPPMIPQLPNMLANIQDMSVIFRNNAHPAQQ